MMLTAPLPGRERSELLAGEDEDAFMALYRQVNG